MRGPTRILTMCALLALAATACAEDEPQPAASTPATTPGYDPRIDPADFVATIDHPLLAFAPGTRTRYRGESNGETEIIEVRVTDETKTILGVPCVVVEDIVTVDGVIHEKTYDWYAQDTAGNVWYFGEDSTEYENGKPSSKHGSWMAGEDGAKPGIVMLAEPGPGDLYRQEYYVGEAEDLAEVLRTDARVTVGGTTYEDVVVTREWTNLEPGVLELKYYAQGTGLIREQIVAGGKGTIDLVEVSTG